MDLENPIFTLTLSLFFLMDAIGNIPVFIAILKKYPLKKQRWIIVRELTIALLTMITFYFGGNFFLDSLGISKETVRIAGGIVLLIISLKLIFPSRENEEKEDIKEPFIVPLAIPLIAGPAILASLMIYSGQDIRTFDVVLSILIAWSLSTLILLCAPFLQKILGHRGIAALERLMGLILILISIQMFIDGIDGFISCKLAA